MSQIIEEYAGVQRVDKLEERVERMGKAQENMERRLERHIDRQYMCNVNVDMRLRNVKYGLAMALLIAVIALIVAVRVMVDKPKAETVQPAVTIAPKVEADLIDAEPAEIGPWDFAAMFQAAEDPAEKQRIGEALEAQGYFSREVPLSWEYQDYIRTYCRLYGCPYHLALAVADWETQGRFNMDAVGQAGEVGIFQLNPGPDGRYHSSLEAATGLDPATPEGNIAGGCCRLGEYLERYEDVTKALMAYNMGPAGARSAWKSGITSTGYTEAVLEALERWERAVWAGE